MVRAWTSKASRDVQFCPSGEKLLPERGFLILVDNLLIELSIEHDKTTFRDALTV